MTDRNPAPDSSGSLKDELLKHIPRLRGFALGLCCNDRERADLLARRVVQRGVALKERLAEQDPSDIEVWMLRAALHEWRLWRKRGDRPHAHDAFAAVVGSLPYHQLEALMAVRNLGLSYASAANLLGVAVGTVKSRINRSTAQLVPTFGDEFLDTLIARQAQVA